ncbi:MAG: bifunctional 4-hydroxy-2-oxoglutarate aldolase/2-dehydro-3-deoxy-phosphogluconate aldolase [Desulfocapsaceae bacterium]
MNRDKTRDQIQELQTLRLVPVVSLASVADGLRLAEVLLEAGLPVMEITYRTACAAEALDAISSRFSELLLIAGTVLTPAQVDSAVAAGAQAIVSPGFTPQLASYCRSREIALFPGVCTPSEVQMAAEAGLSILKFFPAEQAGGLKMLMMFRALYQEIRFMPTGGINPDNLLDYLKLENIICCGGTWLCPEQLMVEDRWDEIAARLSEARNLIESAA